MDLPQILKMADPIKVSEDSFIKNEVEEALPVDSEKPFHFPNHLLSPKREEVPLVNLPSISGPCKFEYDTQESKCSNNEGDNHDMKLQIQDLSRCYHELERRMENEREELAGAYKEAETRRSQLESKLHSVEVELESVRVQLEEESKGRLDAERQLSMANDDTLVWRNKYDTECRGRQEEVEEISKRHIMEVEQLKARVVEAKTKILTKTKTNTTELEMTIEQAMQLNDIGHILDKPKASQNAEVASHTGSTTESTQPAVQPTPASIVSEKVLKGLQEEIRYVMERRLRALESDNF